MYNECISKDSEEANMDISERVEYFLELMSCSQNIGYWCFDMDRNLLRSTSPYRDEQTFVRLVFGDEATFAKIKALGEAMHTPVISYNDIDLCSAFVFEYQDDALYRLHILGPLYQSDISVESIEKELDRHYMSSRFRRRAINMLAGQPVLSATRFWPYVQMLHFAVNEEKIGFDVFRYTNTKEKKPQKKNSLIPDEPINEHSSDHAGVYQTQQDLFGKIERGDLNYAGALNHAVSKASYGAQKFGNPNEKAYAYAIKFITLSVAAAIRGGLSPVIAYSVGDYYETQIAGVKSTAERKHILDTMYADFINRVHKLKKRADISKPIQVCCDYIDMHIYDTIELEQLGKMIGYTKYYLSRKFKQEMGMSIWDYINERKVEEAKVLLADPAMTIQDVSDKLNYCSRSYFSEVFEAVTGMWPSNYRAIELKM